MKTRYPHRSTKMNALNFPDEYKYFFMATSRKQKVACNALPESTVSIQFEKVDVLVPLPQPKFGSSSLDSMVFRFSFRVSRVVGGICCQ